MKNKYIITKVINVPKCGEIDKNINAFLFLWNENLSNQSIKQFSWLNNDNPCGQFVSWVAFTDVNDEPVGTGSFLPRKFWLNGREVLAGVAINFAVDKAHRVFGPALQLQKAMIAQSYDCGFDFIIGFPNKASKGIFIRAGYRVLGEAEIRVKLLKTEYIFTRFLKMGAFAKLASTIIDTLLCHLDDMLIRIKKGYIFRSEILKSCDNRFDDLWMRVKGQYSITGEKTSSYLNWRYAASVFGSYSFFCLFEKNTNILRGYIVYSIKENIAYISEICAEDNGRVLKCLFLKYAIELRAEGISSISINYLADKKFDSTLKQSIFIKRPYTRGILIFIDENSLLNNECRIVDKSRWFILDGDLDL